MSKITINPEALVVFTEGDSKAKGVFTVRSLKTGRDFTFEVKRSEWEGRFYTHIRVETQYLEFKYVGNYFGGKVWRKKQLVDTPASQAVAWVLRQVSIGRFDLLKNSVEVMHLGKCLKCNRTLTDATSIEIGLGPVCRGQ